MKLHNPGNAMIFLRDEVKRTLITLKPGGIISVEPHQRALFATYVQSFNLKWLLDADDLPSGTDPEAFEGTYAHFKKQGSDDATFDATKAMAQSDAEEIADIWKEQDTIRFVPHASSQPQSQPKKSREGADTDFIFPVTSAKESTPQNSALEELTGEESEGTVRGDSGGFYSPLSENISAEGPDYLRNAAAPEGLEGFGEELLTQEDPETDGLPDNAPVTMSQLTLSTKSQLWQMADQLGVDATGSKKEVVAKIVKYYWKVHYTNLQLMK